ncbi:MAG: Flp family type IVb pilin [Pseudomonadota bacterium]
MRTLLKRLAQSNDGATAIEYALIASFIGIVIVATITSVGGNLDAIFQVVDAALN